jgi:hypothetical protein
MKKCFWVQKYMHGHIADLAVAIKEHIVPYLPFLIEGASKGIGKSAGEITVKEIWGKLEPKLKAKNEARQAVYSKTILWCA